MLGCRAASRSSTTWPSAAWTRSASPRIVGGVADGCRKAGAALIGGETAEHPGLMAAEDVDLAGFCIGVGERSRLLDGTAARAGDAIVGLASSGLHSNGYSLVRALVADHELELRDPYQAVVRRVLGDGAASASFASEPHLAMATLGEVLLTPTRVYALDVLAIRAALVADGSDLRGIAHVTGGGLPGNVPRALPDTLGARAHPRVVADALGDAPAGRARRASPMRSCEPRSTAGWAWS